MLLLPIVENGKMGVEVTSNVITLMRSLVITGSKVEINDIDETYRQHAGRGTQAKNSAPPAFVYCTGSVLSTSRPQPVSLRSVIMLFFHVLRFSESVINPFSAVSFD
jgi:hypothetical protein